MDSEPGMRFAGLGDLSFNRYSTGSLTLAGSKPTTPTYHPTPLPNAMLTRFFTTVDFPELGGPRTITLGPRTTSSEDEASPFVDVRCLLANMRFRSSTR